MTCSESIVNGTGPQERNQILVFILIFTVIVFIECIHMPIVPFVWQNLCNF